MKKYFKFFILLACITAALLSAAVVTNASGYEYDIQLTVTDGNGNEFEYADNVSSVKISGVVNSAVAEKFYPYLYVAFYDYSGNLKGVSSKKLTFWKANQGQTQSFSFTTNNLLTDGGYISVFVWDGMKPLTDRYQSAKPCVSLKGIYRANQTLTVEYIGSASANLVYKWYYSDGENGEYKQIDGASQDTLVVSDEFGGKWVKAEIGNNGVVLTTEAKYIEPGLKNTRLELGEISNANENTPPENVFRIDGVDFVLLDTTQSDSAKYFVVSENALGEAVSYTAGYGKTSDASSYENLAYYLNNEYKENTLISEKIINYIDNNVAWNFENNSAASHTKSYADYGGIGILSQTEILKYSGKLGFSDSGKTWWTRSAHGTNTNDINAIIAMSGEEENIGKAVSKNAISDLCYIRPAFYLSENFFDEVPVNLEATGENVKKVIFEGKTREELIAAGYSENAIEKYFDDVHIDGIYQPYQPLSIISKKEITSYAWYISDEESGTYSQISDSGNYTTTFSDGGKWIKGSVVFADGTQAETVNAKYIEPAYSKSKIDIITADSSELLDTAMANTPDKYVFTAEGIDFVLLDVTEDDDAKYLLMTKNTLGEDWFYTNADREAGGFEKFAEYINGDYKEKNIPKAIREHIYSGFFWQSEIGYWINEEGVHNCEIAVPSVAEIRKYSHIMGLQDDMQIWWTRSGHGKVRDSKIIMMPKESGFLGQSLSCLASQNSYYIRPIFYVDSDFFDSVKLSYAGDEVRKRVLSEYSSDLYSESELKDLFLNKKERFDFTLTRGENLPDIALGAEYITTDGGEFEISVSFGEKEIFSTVQSLEGDVKGILSYDMVLPYGIEDLKIEVLKNNVLISEKNFKNVIVTNDVDSNFASAYNIKGYCYPLSDVELFSKSGANITRPNYPSYWATIETEKGVYDWTEMDTAVANADEHGYNVMPILCYGNPLYDDGKGYAPSDYEAIEGFVNYAKAFAERYPQILYYEVWNEPGGDGFWKPRSNYKDYTALVQITERALKSVNPDIEVISGAFADANQYFSAKLFEEGIYGYSDIISSHPYVYYYGQGADESLESRMTRITKLSLEKGGWKKNFITEIGFPTSTGSVTEDHSRQAEEQVKQFVIGDANDIDASFIYSFRDYGFEDDNPECRFGVVDINNEPKKAYISVQNYLKNTLNAIYMGEIALSENVTGYVYHNSQGTFMLMWSIGNDETITFGSEVSFEDLYGNHIGNGSEAAVTSEPIYVKGLSADWAVRAAAESLEKKIDNYLAQVSMTEYKSIFEESIANANALNGSELPDANTLLGYYNLHINAATSARSLFDNGEITQIQLSTLLSIIEMSGRQWVKLYSIANPTAAEVTDARIEEASKKLSDIEMSEKTGSVLTLSRSAIKLANSYYNKIERIKNSGTDDALAQDIVQGYAKMIEFMCISAEMLCGLETPNPENILIKVPANAAVLEYNQQGSVDVSVYNYDERSIENAALRVVDSYGEIAAEKIVSVGANSSVRVSVDMMITDGGAKNSMVDIMLISDGITLKSEKAVVMKQMEAFAVYGEEDNAYKADTDKADVFAVDGQEFILLDMTDDENSKYLCITKDIYGPNIKPFYDGTVQKFDAEDEKSIAYWLNNSFCDSYLPASIAEHIDFNHYYTTEKGSTSGESPFDTQTKCGVALLSVTELNNYRDKLGMADGNFPDKASWMWLLRSMQQRPDWNWNSMMVNVRKENGKYFISTQAYFANSALAVRPIFHLDEGFFKEVSLDLSAMGTNIRKILRENYTREELGKIYSELDLARYYDDQGTVENLSIVGEAVYEGVLTPAYNLSGFSYADEDVEASLEFAWKIADSQDGEYEYIENETSKSLSLEYLCYNQKYVKCEITLTNGESVETPSVFVQLFDSGSMEGSIESGSVRGIMSAGNTLRIKYEASEGIADEDIICEWYKSSAPDSGYLCVEEGMSHVTGLITSDRYYYAMIALANGEIYTTDKVRIAGYNASNSYWPKDMASDTDPETSVWYRDELNHETRLDYTASGLQAADSKLYFAGVAPYSNQDYMFTIDNQKFVLVDTIETSDSARYKVIADSSYGKEIINETGLLNVKRRMPESLTKYIDDSVWYEGSVSSFGNYLGAKVSGVYPLAPKDLKNYGDKVGLISCDYQTGEVAEYILNGNSKSKSGASWAYVIKSYDVQEDVLSIRINGRNWTADSTAKNFAGVRPVFHIDYRFFKEVALDLDTVGENVRKILRENYTKEELSVVYSEEDLARIYN